MRILVAIVLLLLPSCAATSVDKSEWENIGPICECKMA